ncbi:hypothetical protein BCU83_13745 [Vibrio breoganii]|uniref:hypothetical protein n=1 Tax=Vibrio breoganii TaxID=553239 RepID=UPI000C84B14A|nr:hypothetical protein [Vibrio breoganii]PMG79276.1 hypothetical protein BCU83_13745 [Vibrio breoganii]
MTTKNIHIFASQINYSGTSVSKGKLRASLAHSLRCLSRMPAAALEKIQWNDEDSHANRIFINDKSQALSDMSELEKSALIDDIAPPAIHNKRQKQTKLSNYRLKLNKVIKSERKTGNNDCADAIAKLINTDIDSELDLEHVLLEITPRLQKRRDQRINAIIKFVKSHNALAGDDRCGSATRCQEIIFKIPAKWSVLNSEFTPDDNYQLVKNFVRRVLPNHPIKFAVTHADENIGGTAQCSHIHVFIDGQNSVTKEYDLRREEFNEIDRYVQENQLDIDEWEHAKKQSKYYLSKARGHLWQEMFLRSCNAYLKHHDKPLLASRALKTQEYEAQLKEMRAESKKPKSERKYSYYNNLKESISELDKTMGQKKDKLENTIQEIDVKLSERLIVRSLTEEEREALANLKKDISELTENITHLSSLKTALDNDYQAKVIEQKRMQESITNTNKALSILAESKAIKMSEIEHLDKEKEDKKQKVNEINLQAEKVKTEYEEYSKLSQIEPGDKSIKPPLKLIKLIDDYYSERNRAKKNHIDIDLTEMLSKIIDAFKNLVSRLQQILIRKYVKSKDENLGDYELSRALKQQSEPELTSERDSQYFPDK